MVIKKGFTLAEILTVLAIIGVGIVLFYFVFFLNWMNLEKEFTRVELQQDFYDLIEKISFDVRPAKDVVINSSHDINIIYPQTPSVTYIITPQGHLIRQDSSTTQTLYTNVDYNKSSFKRAPNSTALIVTLVLEDKVFGEEIEYGMPLRIWPRLSLLK